MLAGSTLDSFHSAVSCRGTLGHASSWALLCLVTVGGCGKGLPDVPIDLSNHDACAGSPSDLVDASAAEIQCVTDHYIFVTTDEELSLNPEEAFDVPGPPTCCEVCAVKDTADDACEGQCKHDLCSRGRDAHIAVAKILGGDSNCLFDDCGFSFEACMDTESLHVQFMTFPNTTSLPTEPYAMQASCDAHAEEPARADGLFTYLEGLGSIPGAGGGLANVEDVVGYCLEHQAAQATGSLPEPATSDGSSTSSPEEGADSTGAETETPGTTGQPEPPSMPPPCGPYATERLWVRPTNNFGPWNEASGGVGGVGAATFMASVTSGGIAYTMFPCDRASDAKCLRIDQLSVEVTLSGSGFVVHLGLVEDSTLMPVTAEGTFEVPAGALRLAARYEWDDQERFHVVTNQQRAAGHVDTVSRSIHIGGLGISSEQGSVSATLSLAANPSNSQPSTRIVESRDRRGGVVLTAETFDPIVHQWMILGVGSWRGESIAPSLPPGRHAVIVYADDVRRARGVAARWVEVAPSQAG